MKTRRNTALMAAADLMACFIGILFLLIQTEAVELEEKKATLEAEITELQSVKDKLEEEIRNLRSKKWEIVRSDWEFHDDPQTPSGRLYVFQNGIYADLQGMALSDDAVRSYLAAHRGSRKVVLYMENGSNDSFLRAQSLAQSAGYSGYTLLVLPADLNPRL